MDNMLMILNASGGKTYSVGFIVAYIIFLVAIVYFLFVRPSKKQQSAQEEMMKGLHPGDTIMTTSGFYGTVIGMEDDTVIVEFGNNKNCRIPMHKKAIADVESADAVYEEAEDKTEESTEETKAGKKK
jgi:preprotein translocase subunit YajC